jgi:CubicO group peptidase (beta-lactamase class C family)
MAQKLSRWRLPVSVVAAAAVLLGLGGCGGGNSPSPQAGSLGSAIDSLAKAEIQQSAVPGMTVAIAKKGTILYEQGYGVIDLSSQQPTDPKIIFEIGSITKQFTAALIMKLEEQGRLRLDDSVVSYLPGYGFPAAITLRMLLTHTSGLADFTNFADIGQWVRQGISETAALTEIAQAGLQFQPGSQYQYSNSNFYLLGSVIEKLTGQSYAANLEQSIFQPLALQNTYYVLPPANLAAAGYRNSGAGLVPAIIWDRSAAFAAGALSTNVDDLAKWDDALLSGKVVSAASFQQMTTSNGFFQNGFSYGFGLALSTFNNRKLMWHSGQIGGFTAENAVFLDNGFTVIVLTNDQDYDTDQFVLKILNAVCGSSQLGGTC